MTEDDLHDARYEAQVDQQRELRYALHPNPNDPDYPGWEEENHAPA